MKNRVLNSPLLKARILELARNRVEIEVEAGMLSGGVDKIKGGGAAQAKELSKRKEQRFMELLESLNEVVWRDLDGMICKMENKRFIRVCRMGKTDEKRDKTLPGILSAPPSLFLPFSHPSPPPPPCLKDPSLLSPKRNHRGESESESDYS